ncbi:hypothetical protein M5K25_005780 [Dendrobium thyrsiflorum]|uniref:Uncharacterized protein n=1 Tax=Dendrobium thyrsiflorum TaxID=117978 RepID=A0ABD0VJK6_DENTH
MGEIWRDHDNRYTVGGRSYWGGSDPRGKALAWFQWTIAWPLTEQLKKAINSIPSFHLEDKLHAVLDEIIFAGQVVETSSEQVMKAVEEIARNSLSLSLSLSFMLEKPSNPISIVAKSVSGRLGR